LILKCKLIFGLRTVIRRMVLKLLSLQTMQM